MILTELNSIDAAFTQLFAGIFKMLGALFALAVATGLIWLILVTAIITWVVKKVWYAGSDKKEKKRKRQEESDDWLTRAQARQETRFENASPPVTYTRERAQNVRKRGRKYTAANEGKTWYPTGWTLNENTGLWEPPDYLK